MDELQLLRIQFDYSRDINKKPLRFLTVKKIKDIGKIYPYFLVRHSDGYLTAVNSKILNIAQKRANTSDDKLTQYYAYLPCNFNEYLSHKRKNNLL